MLERCTNCCGRAEEGTINSAGKGGVEETVSQKSDI